MKCRFLPASLSRILATVVLVACLTLANAATETVLHQFVNFAQGSSPAGGLVADAQGNLYGTTYYGGTYGFGTVFRLSRNSSGKWAQADIHNFTGLTDGYQPNSLAIDAAGNLFGATSGGGSSSFTTQGYGIVFELSRSANGSWALTVVHAFAGQFADGYTPAGVALDSAGNVYGVAYGGIGNSNACSGQCGLIFRVVHSASGWTEHTIYEFKGKQDGALPVPSLTFDSAGNLYGATQASSLPWVIFQLTPTPTQWTETTLFTNTNPSTQGGVPNGVTFDASGNIFATSQLGGPTNNGVVFELVHGSSGWTQTVLHTFTGGADGSGPAGNPRFDSAGNLVGTTYWGGTAAACASNLPVGGCGTVYHLSPSSGGTWTESILYVFTAGSDGVYPTGPLVIDSTGNLIGTTLQGSIANAGTVFELAPSSGGYTEAQVYGFPATDGNNVRGGLVADSAGNLYGVASSGSLNDCPSGGYPGCGSIFKLTRLSNGTWQRTVIHNFTGALNGDGSFPYAGLTFDSAGNLYGTTSNGILGGGTVFKLTPTSSGGWSFRTIYQFGAHHNDGYNPWGVLALDAARNIYGTTIAGGNGSYLNCNYCGTVFKLAPAASGRYTESVIYNFQGGNDGSFPTAGVIFDSAGNLYGTTSEGGFFYGDQGFGVVFKLSPQSNGTWKQSVLYTFTGTSDGTGPRGSVIFDNAGNLYGTAPTGGTGNCNYGCGVVFKLAPTASGPWDETVLYSFLANGDGAFPLSNLTFDASGNLYGTASAGGTGSNLFCPEGCGTVFKLAPSAGGWNETVLYNFQGPTADGATPYAGIIFDAAGNIYGTTSGGGINGEVYLNGGTVFQLTP